jgi:predicted GTPase
MEVTMESELEQVQRAAQELGQVVAVRDARVAARALRLAERLAEGRFHVSVLGEFKRGKSTLINAIVGGNVLPTGALPLTAVATEVRFGARQAEVVHTGGERRQVDLDELADYVTEARNPGNERQVDWVEISVAAWAPSTATTTRQPDRLCLTPMERSWCSRRTVRCPSRNESC